MPILVSAAPRMSGARFTNWSAPGWPVVISKTRNFPKRCGHLAGKRLVETEEMSAKIRAAVAAKSDRDFLVIARTDSRALENFDGAVQRANAYVAAGADAIFPEALQTKEEFRDFAKEVKVPLLANMTEFGKSPLLGVQELGELGYRMVIFPQSAFRVSMKTTDEFFRALKKAGTQNEWLDQMQTRKELYELLDYDPAAESWTGYRSAAEPKAFNVKSETRTQENI